MLAPDALGEMPMQVMVVDDSLLIREGIVSVLEAEPDVRVVATCTGPEEALDALRNARPDVVLTDIRMPPTHTDEGIVLARALGERYPDLGVVVLSQHVSPEHAVALLDQGSSRRGYLLKDRLHDVDTLVGALRTVARGGCHIDPLVIEALMAGRNAPASPVEDLTPREREILALIAEGWNNQAIADRLVLSRRAVEKHASAVFLKLGLANAQDTSRRVRATLMFLSSGPSP